MRESYWWKPSRHYKTMVSERHTKWERLLVKNLSRPTSRMWGMNLVKKWIIKVYLRKNESLTKIKFRLIGQIKPFNLACMSWSLELTIILKGVFFFFSFFFCFARGNNKNKKGNLWVALLFQQLIFLFLLFPH